MQKSQLKKLKRKNLQNSLLTSHNLRQFDLMKNFTTIFLPSFFLLSLFLLLIYTPSSYAAEIDNVVSEQNRVIQNQQQFEQDKQRKGELQNMEVERKDQAAEEAATTESVEGKNLSKHCFEVTKITFTKNKILSKKEEENLAKNLVGQCLTPQEVNQLLKKISDYLVEKEYATSKAVLSKKDATTGELVIEIVEGQLEDLVFNKDTSLDKAQKFTAFGVAKKHEPLNLHDVVIGLDQINRLPSNAATMKVVPGSYPNGSIIAVQNQPKNTLRTNFTFDDLGSQSTGKRRDTAGLAYDNLLHLNDSLNFSRTANDFSHKKNLGKSEALNFGFSVPFKGNLLTLSHTQYSYSLLQPGDDVNTNLKASGQSLTSSAVFESILFKHKKYRLKSQLGLTTRDINNFVDDVKVDSSSRKATVATFAFPNKFFLEKGNLLLKPSYVKGLKSLGARNDSADIASQSAHSQFDMLKFYANYSHGFEVPVLKVPFNYVVSFDSQIAKQKLYSSDQFFIGGAYTVRGFESGSIGGDSGYLVKNEASFNVGKLLAPLLQKQSPSALVGLYNFSITPFYDYGYIKERGINQAGRLAGGGFRTSFAQKNLTANLTMAWVANKSVLLQNHYRENQAVYFDITTNFGFF